ncbi:MAG TPA: hypothetical protein VFZ65_03310 [Planctomycetota bacterium]|nr:hypothetical protein [Planctomycetota bacterium]
MGQDQSGAFSWLRRSARAMACVVATACLAFPGCAVRLIADHDEIVVAKTVALQEKAEALFLALEDAAATPDPDDDLYAAHAGAYNEILVLLRVMEVRAASLSKNEITTEQVQLLRDSFEKMKALHQKKSAAATPGGFSAEALQALRQAFVQQVQSILTLQEELRR